MKAMVPVSVMANSFRFCRFGLAALVWLALIFQSLPLVVISLAILLWSFIAGVGQAPLVLLYRFSLGRWLPGDWVMLDRSAIRFAHGFGFILNLAGLILLLVGANLAGWIVMAVLGVAKSSGAFGFCSAAKLYGCMNSDSCCRVGRKLHANR